MQGRNCPNCGAPLDKDVCKCPYCNTSYFDISSINLDAGEPFYLKVRTHWGSKPVIVSALVRAVPSMSITMEAETVHYGGESWQVSSIPKFSMEFEGCTRQDRLDLHKEVLRIEAIED